MIPTAVRFAAVTSKPATQKISRAAINVASLGAVATLFVGWPLMIQRLETKNHGAGTVPIPEQKREY